jgi:hypothetical protein
MSGSYAIEALAATERVSDADLARLASALLSVFLDH